MFVHWPGKTNLGVGVEQVVAVIESINAPNISIPEIGTEPTKAYLVGVRLPAGSFTVFCYLLQLESMRPIIYLSDPPEVSIDEYPVLEGDAIQFAESMGFMLDNMNFRARPPEEMMALAEQLPFFRDPPPPQPKAPSGPLPLDALEEVGGIDQALASVLQAARGGTPAAGMAVMAAVAAGGGRAAPPPNPTELAALARLLASF
jgi:hypothetical protein